MKCTMLIDSIEAYLGGTLPPGQREDFDRHVAECGQCRAELERCRQEDRLYRQALERGKLQGTLRNTVLAKLTREHKPVPKVLEARRRITWWIAPVAAAAQFFIVFWLSGTLMFKSAPEVVETSDGRIVAVKWVRDFKRFKYFSIKNVKGMDGPELAEEDKQVD